MFLPLLESLTGFPTAGGTGVADRPAVARRARQRAVPPK